MYLNLKMYLKMYLSVSGRSCTSDQISLTQLRIDGSTTPSTVNRELTWFYEGLIIYIFHIDRYEGGAMA